MIKNITVNENQYTFVCGSRDTRNGFAHDCTLYKNEYEIGKATCHYLNRTWESYQYQSVMCNAINSLLESERRIMKDFFKYENGYKKMTEKRNTEFALYLATNEKAKNYREFYELYKIVRG